MILKYHKNIITIVSAFIFFALFFSYSAMGSVPNKEDKGKILNKVYKLQIPFIENKGQIEDKNVKYYAKTFGGTVFITKDRQIVYSLPKYEAKGEGQKVKGWVIKENLVGASLPVPLGRQTGISNVKGENKAITKVNYFKGKDPSNWQKNIPTYNLISFGEIYKGIELKLKAYGKNIEKLFYIKAGANPENIKLKIKGAKSLNVNKNGELEVETGLGVVKFTKPVAYQGHAQAGKKYVEVAYVIKGNEYSFKVKDYDRTKKLIIDPLLASTYLGGNGCDEIHSIAIDSSGNVYVAGYTHSSDFPVTPDVYDTGLNGNSDAFVSKFDSNLQHLLASTYLGGSGYDWANSIAINSGGNVYVAGSTSSADFPVTPGAYDTTWNGNTAFVSKLDGNLQNLLASTFLGGSDTDDVYSISIDSNGNVYVAGITFSLDFPVTEGAYDTSYNTGVNSCDAFVSKFDSNLENLLASTFLGGSNTDGAYPISIDSNGNVYVAGHTSSSEFPTTSGAYDTTLDGEVDAFVSKFDSNLQNLLASTYLGGSITYEYVYSIAIDSSGNVYVAGITFSSDFPVTPGAYDTSWNGGEFDAFVSKFDGNLQNLLASTFLGGVETDHIGSISIAASGNIYVAGHTSSSEFPTTSGAYDTTLDGEFDAFVSKFDSNLENLLASTFLGGSDTDDARSISIDSTGNVYVAGITDSLDFPVTPGAYDTSWNGGDCDAFVSKFDGNLSAGGASSDADSDGLPDNWENQYFGNLNQGPNNDYDNDGLTNLEEYNYVTNPTKLDTDDDRYSDKEEIDAGTNPTDPNDYPVSENQPPTASFTYSPENPVAGQEITFDASASQDPDGEIAFYEWNFGDGNGQTTTDSTITHTYDTEGNYQAKVTVVDNEGAETTSVVNIVVGSPINVGYAIIVAGQGIGKKAIDHCANNAYRALRNLGFDDGHIFYLNSKRPQDVDGHEGDEVDFPATLGNFTTAVGKIKEEIKDNPVPLVLYLIGHGDKAGNVFYFDTKSDLTDEDILSSWKLNEELVEKFPFSRMLIIIEACYSGSFITEESVGDTISAENRIIITAAHDHGWWGRRPILTVPCSSDFLWKNLSEGLNVKDAFVKDATSVKRWDDRHYSWLDDDGDKKGNPPHNLGEDGELAETTRIGTPNTENLELTGWLFARLFSPSVLCLYDSQDRVTGLVNGEVKEEIPNSIYDEQNEIVAISSPSDSYRYKVVGTADGTYGLEITSVEDGETNTFKATDIPTSPGAVHEYTINWDALSEGEKGVTVKVDSNGNGVYEKKVTSDSELTGDEFSSGGTGGTGGCTISNTHSFSLSFLLLFIIPFILFIIRRKFHR